MRMDMVRGVQDAGAIPMAQPKAFLLPDVLRYVVECYHLHQPCLHTGTSIRHIYNFSTSSMGRKQKPTIEPTRYEKNKLAFIAIQYHWETVKIGYLREVPMTARDVIERIYREELDPTWLPNRYCKGCYFKAVEQLIHHFQL